MDLTRVLLGEGEALGLDGRLFGAWVRMWLLDRKRLGL